MDFLRLIIISFFLTQGFSAFAIVHKSDCNKNISIFIAEDSNQLANDFEYILQELDWKNMEAKYKTDLASVGADIALCNKLYDNIKNNRVRPWGKPDGFKPETLIDLVNKMGKCLPSTSN